MSAETTHWDIKFDETGVDGRPTIRMKFGMGHGQEVRVNIRPPLATEVAKSLLLAHSDYRGWEEDQMEDATDIVDELSWIVSQVYVPDSDFNFPKVMDAIKEIIDR